MENSTIGKIQAELAKAGLDGWLLYDFHGTNDIAVRFLGLRGILTRRSFYYIPASGGPVGLVHAIEKAPWQNIPGTKRYFSSYRALEAELAETLKGAKRVAMEYSPFGRLPYVGKVDAGTVELVRSFGVEVVSSADLVAAFDARLTEEQIATHRTAADNLNRIKDEAFAFIKSALANGRTVTEYDVVRLMLDRFVQTGMVTDFDPICAAGPNGGKPHYEATKTVFSESKKGDLIVLDLWARLDAPGTITADITWMAYAGEVPPDLYERQFALLGRARDAAVQQIRDQWGRKEIYGYEVDDVCRNVIVKEKLADHFTHRTGHSIATATHGPGPNIDNMETEDRRQLMPGHLFSIEPGLYFNDYGMRSEINVLITENGPEITTQPVQQTIVRLLP